MKKIPRFLFLILFLFSTQLLLVSCDPATLARLIGISITDGPIDDPLYGDVFITVDGIKIDGKKLDGFQRQTINISELQNGISTSLFKDEVAVGTYESISLILDFDKDDSGEVPGCYANTVYGRKITLANYRTGKQEVTIEGEFVVDEDEDSEFVIDFDLRKTIRGDRPGDEGELSFIDVGEMGKALRMADSKETGNLQLELTLEASLPEAALGYLIYVYPKGGFDRNAEFLDSDGNGINFENAVVSGKIVLESTGGIGTATLPFILEGDYELVIEAYERYEFSQTRLGYLAIQGQESVVTPFSISKGKKTELGLNGTSIIE
ncbi:MAG: DUF4382 domain-containing protein [Bacteroidia bacterium]|nr:DUF4382 domain-containing protein [Bacteroidia bacterium]